MNIVPVRAAIIIRKSQKKPAGVIGETQINETRKKHPLNRINTI
ncbi:hypothetical protein B34_02598 [Bacillus licheniformis]|nr:hypothetical protein B34_02598 [Bacillus licheniformis]